MKQLLVESGGADMRMCSLSSSSCLLASLSERKDGGKKERKRTNEREPLLSTTEHHVQLNSLFLSVTFGAVNLK